MYKTCKEIFRTFVKEIVKVCLFFCSPVVLLVYDSVLKPVLLQLLPPQPIILCAMGVEKEFKTEGKSQGSALVSFWNTGEASALNTFPGSREGVASTDCAARSTEFSAHIQNVELAEVLVPGTLQGGDLGSFEGNGAQVPSLLHTEVCQVDTEPPCQLRGTALDLEYCAGASG